MLRWIGCFVCVCAFANRSVSTQAASKLPPPEPIEIGLEPQYFIDDHVVDNRFAIKYKSESLIRVFHAPKKHPANPLIEGDGGFLTVQKDQQTKTFRLWYQTWQPSNQPKTSGKTALAYAESKDGLAWDLPTLKLFRWKGSLDNNVVWTGRRGRRASSPFLVDVPESERRGYRYLMFYRDTDGMRLIGSQDGIHWDADGNHLVSPIHSDTQNSLVYDEDREEYVIFCRAKHVYRTFQGNIRETGASRRVARMSHPKLWDQWPSRPRNIMIPDTLDEQHFNFFYGMSARRHAGIYWGFVWPFKMNTDIHTELAYSRDGRDFSRFPLRPKLVALGEEGSWDDGMVFACQPWLEVGDEWWIYYAGWDGPHQTRDRKPGIGLATIRKEGFVSLRGPRRGGVVITHPVRWPGGQLQLNADATKGEVQVRVSDADRKVLPGFDYDDCVPLKGDGVAQTVGWNDASIASLRGRIIRLEILLTSADLYTFRSARE